MQKNCTLVTFTVFIGLSKQTYPTSLNRFIIFPNLFHLPFLPNIIFTLENFPSKRKWLWIATYVLDGTTNCHSQTWIKFTWTNWFSSFSQPLASNSFYIFIWYKNKTVWSSVDSLVYIGIKSIQTRLHIPNSWNNDFRFHNTVFRQCV